mgnify:CR=1 FL=1
MRMRLASTPGLASMARRTAAMSLCSPAAQKKPAPGGSDSASTAAGSALTHCRSTCAALASVLGEYGRILQIVPEFYDPDLTIARLDQLAEISLKYSIPTTFSPLFRKKATVLADVSTFLHRELG